MRKSLHVARVMIYPPGALIVCGPQSDAYHLTAYFSQNVYLSECKNSMQRGRNKDTEYRIAL